MKSPKSFLLLLLGVAAVGYVAGTQIERASAQDSAPPSPRHGGTLSPAWPAPTTIVNRSATRQKLPRQAFQPIYQVPPDRWLVITDFELKGPLGTTLACLPAGKRAQPVTKMPGQFVGNEANSFPHNFHSSVGFAFPPSSRVALRDESGSSQVTWYFTGYLVPRAPMGPNSGTGQGEG